MAKIAATKFKIGDRVRITTTRTILNGNKIGDEFVIESRDDDWDGFASWYGKASYPYRYRDDQLELVEPPKLYHYKDIKTALCEVLHKTERNVLLSRVDTKTEYLVSLDVFNSRYVEYVPPVPTEKKIVKKEGWIIHASGGTTGNRFAVSNVYDTEELAKNSIWRFTSWRNIKFEKIEWEEEVDVPVPNDDTI